MRSRAPQLEGSPHSAPRAKPVHSSEDPAQSKEACKQWMLERTWGKGRPRCFCECKLLTVHGEHTRALETEPPCDLSIPVLGVYRKKTRIQKDTCNSPLSTALIYTRQEREATTVSTNRRMVPRHNGICSGRKESEIMPLAAPWMHLEKITVSELRQKERPVSSDTIYKWDLIIG